MENIIDEQILQEMTASPEMETDDSELDRLGISHEMAELYGSPTQEEKHNQHIFLSKTTDKQEVDRFTFLNEEETGRPLFSMRFMLDIEDICKHYLDEALAKHGEENKISKYWRRKIDNVTSSGMSKNGFIQMMNITRKMDMTRKSSRGNIENLKGGTKK